MIRLESSAAERLAGETFTVQSLLVVSQSIKAGSSHRESSTTDFQHRGGKATVVGGVCCHI